MVVLTRRASPAEKEAKAQAKAKVKTRKVKILVVDKGSKKFFRSFPL